MTERKDCRNSKALAFLIREGHNISIALRFSAEKISVTSVRSVVHSVSVKHEELTGQIIGAAMSVLNELKPGLDEKLYENALVIELAARGLAAEQQREFPVHYRGHFVGRLIPDLIVEGKVIADTKVATG